MKTKLVPVEKEDFKSFTVYADGEMKKDGAIQYFHTYIVYRDSLKEFLKMKPLARYVGKELEYEIMFEWCNIARKYHNSPGTENFKFTFPLFRTTKSPIKQPVGLI